MTRPFSPLARWTQVDRRDVQAALRRLFAAWGLPGTLRVDNGAPWGADNELPPDLALWLIGLGVAVHHNRPRRCQENGHVERSHGVLAAWAEPSTCTAPDALQARLTAAAALQREDSPALRGRSRSAAFPALGAGGRADAPAAEAALFDEARVWAALAGRVATRVVDRVGRISVDNRPLGVGRRWAGQAVTVRLDPGAVAWAVQDRTGAQLARHPAPELSRERILALEVSHRRSPRPPPGAKPGARDAGGQPYTR